MFAKGGPRKFLALNLWPVDVVIDLSRRIGQEPGVEVDRQLSFRQFMQVYAAIMSIVVSQVNNIQYQ